MATTNIRYAPSGGLNVRNSAAGTAIITLNSGDLMYDVPGVATVTKSLNGTVYEWVKVHYYKSDDAANEGEGWVAKKTTTQVSTSVPAKSQVIKSDAHLKQYQMLTHARYIFKYLRDNKWSKTAIYAVLGNMEVESYMSPGKTEDGGSGYGLVQWTPPTKLTDWLGSGADKSDIDNQLRRILHESKNNLQWDSSKRTSSMDPLSFSDFTTSTKSYSALAEYFVRCYEQPADVNSKVAARQKNAKKWSTLIDLLL
ncbi:MAG: hypothetical protein K2M91_06795 [Lachnospiraceae bacterium]|nr:hypothetical protein [Lachnospiraceae bacterium]